MEELFFCPSCMAKLTPEDGKCPVCGSELNIENAPHQLPVNSILNGRYLVGKVLGAGGFGITYIGYDLRLDVRVAIKEYYPSGVANRSTTLAVFPTMDEKDSIFEIGKARFLKEAKTLSELVEDGNIVTLRDYFEENGTAYIVMEYLEGEDLSHYAKEHGPFALDEALDLLEPAMLALDKVHKKGLIHRDISPSNIMVLGDGRVKVLDFGSARLQNASGERSLTVMLKHGYAPEEQYRPHGEQGPWTDVYAMSATVYKLITGKTPPAATERMFEDTLELPSKLGAKLTPAQEKALMHGLALRAPDRTQSMAELAASLRQKEEASPAKQAVAPKKKAAAGKTAKPKNRLLIIAAAVIAVLAVCLTVPKAVNSAGENNVEDVQDTHLAELAAAREAIAGHSETTISASYDIAVAVKTTGTVIAGGLNYCRDYGQLNIDDWKNIAAVSAGLYHTVGLKADGAVVAVGNNESGQCNVGDWAGIVAVSTGTDHTVGLKADGTVVAVGDNGNGQCAVDDWKDIVAVSAGSGYTVGLKADGTVAAVGSNEYGQCDVSDWADIVAVSAGMYHAVGLKLDGTVVAAGNDNNGRCKITDWTNIVAVSAGGANTMGLKADGTVVVVGDNGNGQCDVGDWKDIVAVSAGSGHTVGLRADGSVVDIRGNYYYGQHDISYWTDIKLPEGAEAAEPDEQQKSDGLAAARASLTSRNGTTLSAGAYHTVGLRTDGTVIAVGTNESGQCSVSGWKDIVSVSAGWAHTVGLKSDGTVVAVGNNESGQCNISDWNDIVAISAGGFYTVGLKADGTVVATGDNESGQCNVSDWSNIIAISAGTNNVAGLKADGTVVVAGSSRNGQYAATEWTDIVALSVGVSNTVGLRSDGTVVVAGGGNFGIGFTQSDIDDWHDIVAIECGAYLIGLKSDGTVVTAGIDDDSPRNVAGWTNITAVSTGYSHTVGLRPDGSVIALGLNYAYQCDVSDWSDIKQP